MNHFLSRLQKKYRYSVILLRQLVITDFKIRYKGSFLGYIWTLLKPLAVFAILYVVFVHFLRIGVDIEHFPIYLLLGVVLWNYFVEVTTKGLSAIVDSGDIMRKLYFPRYVIVIAGSMSALINLAINLLVVGLFMVLNGVTIGWGALWLAPLILELFIFALSVAFLLSALYVKFRDINYIWEVVLQAGFYATPILYPIQLVSEKFPEVAKVIMLSPVAQIIQDARAVIVTPQTITVSNLFNGFAVKLIPFVIVAIAITLSVVYFKRRSPYFAEEI